MLHLAGELGHGLKAIREAEGAPVQSKSCRIEVADHQCAEDSEFCFFCQAEIVGCTRKIAEGVVHEQVLIVDLIEIRRGLPADMVP